MSDFLSFIVVEHIQFFHGALQFFSNVMIILYDQWSYRIIITLCTLTVFELQLQNLEEEDLCRSMYSSSG